MNHGLGYRWTCSFDCHSSGSVNDGFGCRSTCSFCSPLNESSLIVRSGHFFPSDRIVIVDFHFLMMVGSESVYYRFG